MDPSSLIFVVIIGIWAVYLVQHWVRRREQLATSRSVDRYSSAMRILERRAPIPVALSAGSGQNRPYVVASVAAKPTVSSAVNSAVNSAVKPAVKTSGRAAAGPSMAGDSRPEAAMSPNDRSTVPARTIVPRRTHRVRAPVLLTLLVATPAVWAAHLFGTLLLWPTVLVTGLFVLDLMLVRSAVKHEAAARRRQARRRSAARRPASQPQARRPAAKGTAGSGAKMFPAAASVRPPARTTAPSMTTSALAVEEVRPVHSQDAVTEVIVLDGSWEPVEVPRPTYTMKNKADRPAASGAALTADSESGPSREPLVPAVAVDELDLDSVLDRRRAAGE